MNHTERVAATLALLWLTVATQPVPAQEQAAASEATAPLLQEITVTATRREESLSRVPISVTALTQESLDDRGIKDFSEVARFTPGVSFDNSGTNNISIRGISGTGGAGTTGIYLDDTPIQMRALAFNPDEALPKSFDIDRVEVLRGPQGTLFGAGSEGGTVRYITTQPSLSKTSIYSREEIATTEHGDPSYEAGAAMGGPLVPGTFGARFAFSYRHDGGWVDRIDPVTLAPVQKRANYRDTLLLRLAAIWGLSEKWSLTPSVYYQDARRNDIDNFWPIYSDPAHDRFVNADPTQRKVPDKFYIASLKLQGDLSFATFISNTSYFHRQEQTGYEGTLYNLGFYQVYAFPGNDLLDAQGVHLPAGALDYRSPSTIDNGQENITQELRLVSNDPSAKLIWTTGVFMTVNRQSYLEQIHDPLLDELSLVLTGQHFPVIFGGIGYDPNYPFDSYFLKTHARDEQYALFGEATYSFTDQLKGTLGARFSKNKYSFETLTGGPQLYANTSPGTGNNSENAFTPKVSLQFQADPGDLYYFTYAKGFRPGGANNPLPYAACAQDFQNFGISAAPTTFNSDSVNSYEVGAKNNLGGRVRLASSIYYIRWNNIQQTVIPPICQISFISNLGQAIAKGADIQADIAVTDQLQVELAAGYTDARYSRDSSLSASSVTGPVVGSGDAITGVASETGGGQPTSPVTATLGVEYRFGAFGHQAFVRGDAEYQGRSKWPSPGQDPRTLQYDEANFVLPGTTFTSLRAGVELGGWQASAFIDNVANSHPVIDFNNTICPTAGVPGSCTIAAGERLLREYTWRPRTYGLTFIYRH
ncbi:MAG: TonB-dependent receptor [Gammaproteobacteria bacterium]|nr:TonB-dependent receptor [Gammaproteobacteria bacterium]